MASITESEGLPAGRIDVVYHIGGGTPAFMYLHDVNGVETYTVSDEAPMPVGGRYRVVSTVMPADTADEADMIFEVYMTEDADTGKRTYGNGRLVLVKHNGARYSAKLPYEGLCLLKKCQQAIEFKRKDSRTLAKFTTQVRNTKPVKVNKMLSKKVNKKKEKATKETMLAAQQEKKRKVDGRYYELKKEVEELKVEKDKVDARYYELKREIEELEIEELEMKKLSGRSVEDEELEKIKERTDKADS